MCLKFDKSFKIDVGWVLQITNKKMSSVMPFAFNAVELHVVTVNGKPWTQAKELCKVLEYSKITKTADVIKQLCSRENYAQKWQLSKFVLKTNSINWPNCVLFCELQRSQNTFKYRPGTFLGVSKLLGVLNFLIR